MGALSHIIISYSVSMFYNKFDSYYYSRPISYKSYNPRLIKQEILKFNDLQGIEVMNYLKSQGYNATDLGGLARGITFEDVEVGKRTFNHNNYGVEDEYYIHQFKDTNSLTEEHPTGTHLVFKSYPEFLTKLRQVAEEKKKRW